MERDLKLMREIEAESRPYLEIQTGLQKKANK
jgi:hypothetical protein